MPRATILVTAKPGSGPAIVASLQDDARITRAYATLGRFEVVAEVVGETHHDLLEAIALVNGHPDQLASETLLDMQVAAAPDLKEATA